MRPVSGNLATKALSLQEKFLQLVDVLSSSCDQPILFIIDELDIIRDTTGLASLIKLASSERLKFLLVGIGSSLSDLLTDHQSVARQLIPVQVPPMTKDELRQIITGAEAKLHQLGPVIKLETLSGNLRRKPR
jgi:Cdc6-like AAA superfamily ATPase